LVPTRSEEEREEYRQRDIALREGKEKIRRELAAWKQLRNHPKSLEASDEYNKWRKYSTEEIWDDKRLFLGDKEYLIGVLETSMRHEGSIERFRHEMTVEEMKWEELARQTICWMRL